jgi:iron(III) transport system ATP-binding protein
MSEVRIEALSKRFAATAAINSISLAFKEGEFTSIVGPSGCGKTTLLRMIAGLEVPDAGEIWIDDQLVAAPGRKIFVLPEKRNIGMVFQSYAVWPHMTTFENIAFPLRVRRYADADIRRLVDLLLITLGLDAQRNRYPGELSGGQQQRVALGRALIFQSRLLLLDEPLANLDAQVRDAVRLELKEVQRRFGVTTIYVTHDQTEALAISDTVVVMKEGRVLQIGSAWDVYHHPADAFVAGFVGQSNLLKGRLKRTDAGRVIDLDIGGTFVAPESLAFAEGDILVGIRPEDISFIEVGAGRPPGSNGPASLTGVVRQTVFQGGTGLCIIDSGPSKIQVQVQVEVSRLASLKEGAAVKLGFQSENLTFFPVEET